MLFLINIVLLILSSIVTLSNTLYYDDFNITQKMNFIYNYIKYKFNCTSDISLIKLNPDEYNLKYKIENKDYIRRIKVNRSPFLLLEAIADKKDDITTILKQYAGAEQSFQHNPLTPKDLGYKTITINSIDNIKIFDENDYLNMV